MSQSSLAQVCTSVKVRPCRSGSSSSSAHVASSASRSRSESNSSRRGRSEVAKLQRAPHCVKTERLELHRLAHTSPPRSSLKRVAAEDPSPERSLRKRDPERWNTRPRRSRAAIKRGWPLPRSSRHQPGHLATIPRRRDRRSTSPPDDGDMRPQLRARSLVGCGGPRLVPLATPQERSRR